MKKTNEGISRKNPLTTKVTKELHKGHEGLTYNDFLCVLGVSFVYFVVKKD